jgi:hypothetical protein
MVRAINAANMGANYPAQLGLHWYHPAAKVNRAEFAGGSEP